MLSSLNNNNNNKKYIYIYACVYLRTYLHIWASLVAQSVKSLTEMQETWVQSLGREDPLE